MPASRRHTVSRPERWKIWAMLTAGTPFSRTASADGIQSTITSAPRAARTCGGLLSGPPGLISTASPTSL